MAHETTVHRFDAELAAYSKGGGFDPALAADGVGEVVESMLQLRAAEEPLASARGDVLVECTDTGDSWLVALSPARSPRPGPSVARAGWTPASPGRPRISTWCSGAGCRWTRPSPAGPGAGRSR